MGLQRAASLNKQKAQPIAKLDNDENNVVTNDCLIPSLTPNLPNPHSAYNSWLLEHPSALGSFDRMMRSAKGKRIVVFLDYDGTLSPIVDDPDRAFMSDEMRAAVREVAKYFPTAIISGRSRDKVKEFVQLSNIYYAGSHGMDIMAPARPLIKSGATTDHVKKVGSDVLFRPAEKFLPVIQEILEKLEEKIMDIQGAYVEDNLYCLSVHFRRVREEDHGVLEERVKSVLKSYSDFHLTTGHMVMEIRPSIQWNKGHALEYLLDTLGFTNSNEVLPLYIGDDRTDEDAFMAIQSRGQGFPILVSSIPKETKASYSLRDPSQRGISMILLQSHSRFLLQTLLNRLQNLEKGVELDYHWVEFGDVRYHVQVSMKNPNHLLLSLSLPAPPPETAFFSGLPFGAIEAIKAAYSGFVQILDPPRDGFNLTLKLNLAKLPPDEEHRHAILVKVASVREVVLGAPLRVILKSLGAKTVPSNIDRLVALVHRPNESFFLIPQAEKVTVMFPMRFKDSIDIVLATSFLQEFVEARRTAGLNSAPQCLWSPDPPPELKGASPEELSANAGFVTIVIFPRHVEGKKLDRTVWSLSTFHAYVSYHVKCSEGFMHTRMRRRVESLIQALDRAKPDTEDSKKTGHNTSFKRLSLKDGRNKVK